MMEDMQVASASAAAALVVVVVLVMVVVLMSTTILPSVFQASAGGVKEYWRCRRPPIVGTILDLLFNLGTLHGYLAGIAREHATFRLMLPGRSECFTADPAVVEHMLKTNFPKYSKGLYNYEILGDLIGDGIFAVDGDKWRSQRKLASYEFSAKILRDFCAHIFRSNALKTAAKISDLSAATCQIDIQEILMKSTLDSIFKVAFGIELDTIGESNETGIRFLKAYDECNRLVFQRYVDALSKVKRALNIGTEAELRKNVKVVDKFVFQIIKGKREQMKKTTTTTTTTTTTKMSSSKEDILFEIHSCERGEGSGGDDGSIPSRHNPEFSDRGKDTSANTLTWFFYML